MAKNTDIGYRNQLLYSVFVRDYGKNGTFKDVEDDLDRIRSLGTDIIWFMPIDWTGPDLSDVIVKMKKIKESEIFAAGSFFADEVRSGVVRAVYTHGEEKIVGLFAIGSGIVGADTGLPDGPYRNLYSGEEVYVFQGAVPVGEDPVILGCL